MICTESETGVCHEDFNGHCYYCRRLMIDRTVLKLCKKCLQMTNHKKVKVDSIPDGILEWRCMKCKSLAKKGITERRKG